MTSWPEETLSEARKSSNGPQPHTYEAIDGLSSPLDSQANVFWVATDGRMTGPHDLWAAIRPQLDATPPRGVTRTLGSQGRPLPALEFLGALQVSLRSAVLHRDRPLAPSATGVAFVHNGLVRRLELVSISRDGRYARAFAGTTLVRRASDVFELRYRIDNPPGYEDGEFRLWAELTPDSRDEPNAPPIAPLGWEMQLRSYLKLLFLRTS